MGLEAGIPAKKLSVKSSFAKSYNIYFPVALKQIFNVTIAEIMRSMPSFLS